MCIHLSQHLYSIHLADQNEECTMQLADHIRVSTNINIRTKVPPHNFKITFTNKPLRTLRESVFLRHILTLVHQLTC